MKTVDIELERLKEAPWNPNRMDEKGIERLKNSLERYGLVGPLVVRPIDKSYHEVLSGNQRLKVLKETGWGSVPCIVLNLNDTEAMLLAQALNDLKGEDDQALKGALLKKVLSEVSESEVLSILPETAGSLNSLSQIDEGDLASHLRAWEEAQSAELNHMQLQFTRPQLDLVREALSSIMPVAKGSKQDNPNTRSTAIFLLCKFYLDRRDEE
jgi:ParB family chromosome partitioning protein